MQIKDTKLFSTKKSRALFAKPLAALYVFWRMDMWSTKLLRTMTREYLNILNKIPTKVNMPYISIADWASILPRKSDPNAFNGWDLFIASGFLGPIMQFTGGTIFWTCIDRVLSKSGVQQWVNNNTRNWRVLQSNHKGIITFQKYRYTKGSIKINVRGHFDFSEFFTPPLDIFPGEKNVHS